MVRAVGIEPTLCHQNRILSPARLPVPPRPRTVTLSTGGKARNQPERLDQPGRLAPALSFGYSALTGPE